MVLIFNSHTLHVKTEWLPFANRDYFHTRIEMTVHSYWLYHR